MNQQNNIEDLYPLSPMQQGMLFHSLLAPDSGVYIGQLACELRGTLDEAAFARAWACVLARHAVLRSGFVSGNVKEPAQVVQRELPLPLQWLDWRDTPPEQQAARLQALLHADQRRGFELTKPPLMRLTLIQTAERVYRFVWTYHHLLFDGWSQPLLLREVFTSYESFRLGREPQLPPVRPFKHYIGWLRKQNMAEAEQFWRGELAGFRSPTPLVVDRAGESADAPAAVEMDRPLPAATSAALASFARQHGLTLNTLVQGAWALLLHRYSGEADVCFGATVSGRPAALPGAETMVGLFINTLPVRVQIPHDATLLPWLQALQLKQASLRQYEYSPLVQIQGWSELPRGESLFESIVVFENFPVSNAVQEQNNGGGSLQISEIGDVQQTNFPLNLIAYPGDELMLRLAFDTGRFDQATVERMLGHLHTLLASFPSSATMPLALLPLLTPAEQQQLLVDWNATTAPVPELFFHQRVEQWAEKTPDAVAIADCRLQIADWSARNAETQNAEWRIENEEISNASGSFSTLHSPFSILSYAELNQRANQLAHHLRSLGVGAESIVGICAEPSAELVIAVLAVLKAGAAFLPLDPGYPAERLQYTVEDARPTVILTQEPRTKNQEPAESPDADGSRFSVLGSLPGSIVNRQSSIVNLADWTPFAQLPTENLNLAVTSEQLAYVIYTSGSTGQPKGVLLHQGGLRNFTQVVLDQFDIRETSRVLQFASFNFDASVSEFAVLAAGATLVVPPPETRMSPPDLHRFMREQRISVATLPPSLLALLEPEGLDGLTTLVSAGERCPWEIALKWAGGRRFLNGYGPTETTVAASYYRVGERVPNTGSVPIGRPIANAQVYLLDSAMQPVPIGVPGELYIGGAGVGRGYLNRPELTDLRFTIYDLRLSGKVDQSTIQNLQSKIYKSGDLARYLPDGSIEFLGRMDDQVKLRGVRIELGEIEAVLRQHPSVRDTAVVLRDERLVAYVVPHQNAAAQNAEPQRVRDAEDELEYAPDAIASQSSIVNRQSSIADLQSHLRERLPTAYLPAAFVELEALPLTPNGKVDRRALPAPDADTVEHAAFVPPRTPEEELVAAAFAHVLKLERVGRDGNFFELGGHSLLATQLVGRLREALGLELPLRAVFESPTVAELAAYAQAASGQPNAPPISPLPPGAAAPLSFGQQRLWFLDQLEPNSPLYVIPTAVRLRGPLDLAALEAALNGVVQRHQSLRTSFESVDGRPVQVIAPAAPVSIPLTDLGHMPADEREATALRLATEEAQRPFDLSQPPLLRASLLRLANDEHIALFSMHHIISDGWSMGVFVREIATLYAGVGEHIGSPLQPLSVQYADYAAWQRDWLQGEALAQQLDFWRKNLAGAPPLLELPTDRPRPSVPSNRGANLSFALPNEVAAGLRTLSQREGTTLFMTLLAAWKVLLLRITNQEDISVGTPIAGRSRPELEGLIGFFINTLVLRTDLRGEPNFRELLRRVRETALNAYAHQDVPFEMVVDALQPERTMSYTPLFQVLFALQNAAGVVARDITLADGLSISALEAHSGTAKFDITLEMLESPAGLAGSLEYNTDLFDESTMQRLSGHFVTLLRAIVATPDTPITRLPLLTEAEQHALLHAYNPPAPLLPAPVCLHHTFAAVVARQPTAIAVTGDGRPVTGAAPAAADPAWLRSSVPGLWSLRYAELNAQANQLAHYLQQVHGVGPGQLVALRLERTPLLVVAVLAILKAGAAYLPLDLSYPPERVQFILDDAQPTVLLTEQTGDRRPATGNLTGDRRPATGAIPSVALDDWMPFLAYPATNPTSAVTPDDLAYVIYTSGSTGQPKGCRVSHANVARLFTATQHWFGFGPADVWTLFHSIAFDFSVWELFGALLYGGRLVVVPYLTSRDPLAFYQLLVAERVTVLNQTPSAFRALMQAEATRGVHPNLAVRTVIFGGEALDLPSLRPWFARHGDQRPQLVNMYGITETTVHVTYRPLTEADSAAGTGSLIGGPIPDLQLYLLDRHMQPVPLGVVGELYVGGAGVAQGYLNRAELTAERFITAPALFAAHHSAIGNRQSAIYKTGDLARRLPNGDLEYLGRADQQVKLRGFRIELGDIEAALARHPSVREAVVLLRDERLVAYVVLQEPRTQNQEPASAQHGSWFSVLGSFLKEKLPDYMVPSAFVELAAFPLTTNGKLDRTALPAPTGERTSAAAYTPPATVVEQTLAAIWAALLRVEQVGRDDNFFALGGDSILSMQVVARAAAAGIRIAPRHLFQYPTLAGLASVATSVGASATPKENDSGPIPLTPIQRWFFMQHRHEPQHWNTSIMLEVPPGLRADWLEAAVAQLVAHHAALRAVFATEPALPFDPSTSLRAGRLTNRVVEGSTEGTEMYMHISDTAAFSAVKPFAVVDVSETPNRKLKAAIESEAEAAQRSLNLAHGPLLRVLFFDAGERRNGRLLLVFHHLVIDGVSLRIVIGDLLTMYRQLSQGHTPQLPPASTPFPTWARRLASHARSPAVQRELDYWRNMAVALPPLPQDFPGGNSYGDTERVFAGLKPDETRALLTALPAATGTQPQEALLTALARTFQRWTGLPRLLVEMDVHGREDLFDDLDLSRSVGWFTAVYPLLLALAATEDRRPKTEANSQYAVRSSQFAVQTDLQQIKEQLRAVPNRGVGYGLLRYLGDDEARAALADIPQPAVSFNYLGQFDQPLAAADSDEPAMPFRVASESVGTEQHPHNQRAAQIYVVAIVAGGQLDMQWSYSGKQYKRATIERLAKWYLEELRGLLALTR